MSYQEGLRVAGRSIGNDPDSFETVIRPLVVSPEKHGDLGFATLKPGEASPLVDPMRLQIVQAMQGAKTAIEFATLKDAQSEISFRIEAMQTMRNFNSGAYDADYFSATIGLQSSMGWYPEHGQTESPNWTLMRPGQPYSAMFVQRDTAPPHSVMAPSIGNIFPFRGECAGAFQMAVYLGLLNGLGPTYFDEAAKAFGTMYVGPWSIGSSKNPVQIYMIAADLGDPWIPGDYLYFKNKDDYLHYAPDGFWTGLNAMYMGRDAHGTQHFSGLGAAWLSEANLRISVADAYYHDCYPHTIDDPQTACRFTLRRRLSLTPGTTHVEAASNPPATVAAPEAPDARTLLASGFEDRGGGLSTVRGRKLGEIAKALSFDPASLSQVASAPLDNPPHMLPMGAHRLIVEYSDAAQGRHDPDAQVDAHVVPPAADRG
ncbi:hypothetical protein [Palleronia abyssalis]|uniref:Protein-glutamine gamma-glutamyltransferase n=1 Tax=Palleronia abyssalis TaxID=1501240 RepID=A0A2R8BWM2_9RHOB|nr:hypothetical protein [Palleronia abyssalis]SPJ24559.1 Protein-glutamine gamma-glutamyltransferase [Palleronia abyssalis]